MIQSPPPEAALPPAVVIHGRRHLALALAADRPLTLLSAPAAGCYAGCGWWRALVQGAGWPDILDCGDAAGRALEAIRIGQRRLVLDAATPAYAQVAKVAAAEMVGLSPSRPPALDLADWRGDTRMAALLSDYLARWPADRPPAT